MPCIINKTIINYFLLLRFRNRSDQHSTESTDSGIDVSLLDSESEGLMGLGMYISGFTVFGTFLPFMLFIHCKHTVATLKLTIFCILHG